ncbi:hypothetical protein L6452_05135 [Arctium lappa]|uniref:Uncharacterized protein n=1 Tax=Arctium lappa TaxID=4217 RepID=A0ACB9EF89_ARCLA|nr:hypothetical protein L6452_05135 [Arctium lappa]
MLALELFTAGRENKGFRFIRRRRRGSGPERDRSLRAWVVGAGNGGAVLTEYQKKKKRRGSDGELERVVRVGNC